MAHVFGKHLAQLGKQTRDAIKKILRVTLALQVEYLHVRAQRLGDQILPDFSWQILAARHGQKVQHTFNATSAHWCEVWFDKHADLSKA